MLERKHFFGIYRNSLEKKRKSRGIDPIDGEIANVSHRKWH